jgi:hypothetical protein
VSGFPPVSDSPSERAYALGRWSLFMST